MYLTVSPLTEERLLMKGLVYGRSEYRTVLRHTAKSAETRRLSSGTSTEKHGSGGKGSEGDLLISVTGKFCRCLRKSS